MSIAGKRDNAWVSAETVQHLHCTVCGAFGTIKTSWDSRALDEALFKHLREKHGGVWSG